MFNKKAELAIFVAALLLTASAPSTIFIPANVTTIQPSWDGGSLVGAIGEPHDRMINLNWCSSGHYIDCNMGLGGYNITNVSWILGDSTVRFDNITMKNNISLPDDSMIVFGDNGGWIYRTGTPAVLSIESDEVQMQEPDYEQGIAISQSNDKVSLWTDAGNTELVVQDEIFEFRGNITPKTDSKYNIGTDSLRFADVYFDDVDVSGQINGAQSTRLNIAGYTTYFGGLKSRLYGNGRWEYSSDSSMWWGHWDGTKHLEKDGSGNFFVNIGDTGLGTTSPQSKLDVNVSDSGVTLQSDDTTDPTLTFNTTNTPNRIDIYLDESATNDKLRIMGQTPSVDTELELAAQDGESATMTMLSGANSGYLQYSSADNFVIYNTAQDKDILFNVNDGGSKVEMMRIDGSESRIGIGTSTPSEKLHVLDGNVLFEDVDSSIDMVIDSNLSTGRPSFYLKNDGDGRIGYFYYGTAYSVDPTLANDLVMHADNDTADLIIRNFNAVSIGTNPDTTPDYELEVGGTLGATGQITGEGTIKSIGATGSPTGAGPELRYTGGEGELIAYDRDAPGYLTMKIRGSRVELVEDATDRLVVDGGVIAITGDVTTTGDIEVAGDQIVDGNFSANGTLTVDSNVVSLGDIFLVNSSTGHFSVWDTSPRAGTAGFMGEIRSGTSGVSALYLASLDRYAITAYSSGGWTTFQGANLYNGPGYAGSMGKVMLSANNANVHDVWQLIKSISDGVGSEGMGASFRYDLENDNNQNIGAARHYAVWTNATDGNETADIVFETAKNEVFTRSLQLIGETGDVNVTNGNVSVTNAGTQAGIYLQYNTSGGWCLTIDAAGATSTRWSTTGAC